MHDARVYRNSPLFERMSERDFIPPNFHLLGDAAYPLKLNLMTPFRDTGHLTRAQTIYNTKLSSARSTIERAFGHLKGKFRRLKYLDISDLELGSNMIAAACVLHNFILSRNYVGLEEENADLEMMEMGNQGGAYLEMAAIQKRNRIVSLF